MSYEFLIAGLPDLKQGSLLSSEALTELLEEQLSEKDKMLWRSLTPASSLEGDESDEDNGKKAECNNTFIKEWFAFNHDLNNILTAAICRKHNIDLHKQIRPENDGSGDTDNKGWSVSSSVSEQILANPNAKDFGLKGTSPIVEEVLRIVAIENLLEREWAIDAIRQAWLEEHTLFNYFGIEKVLSYWLQNEILHRWDKLTMETGQRVFREMVDEMKQGVHF